MDRDLTEQWIANTRMSSQKRKNSKKTKFSTWAVRDAQDSKENYPECVSWLALKRYAEYMTETAKKYWLWNWIKWIPENSYEQSMVRHMQKYFANKYNWAELEPDVDHLAAMFFNLQGLMHECEKLKQLWAKKKSWQGKTKNLVR